MEGGTEGLVETGCSTGGEGVDKGTSEYGGSSGVSAQETLVAVEPGAESNRTDDAVEAKSVGTDGVAKVGRVEGSKPWLSGPTKTLPLALSSASNPKRLRLTILKSSLSFSSSIFLKKGQILSPQGLGGGRRWG